MLARVKCCCFGRSELARENGVRSAFGFLGTLGYKTTCVGNTALKTASASRLWLTRFIAARRTNEVSHAHLQL